nr:uncharacterized protein LOC108122567 [Drosophila bipectinata]
MNFSEAVSMKFTNLVCESYNQSWFVFHNCRLKAVRRDRIVLNINGTLLYPAQVIHVHGKLFKRANGYKPWLIDVKLDVCRFVKRNYNPVAKMIYNLFKKFTNINHTCPFEGPQIIKGFYLKPELLGLPFPTGDYLLSLRWLYDYKLQYDTNASFEFIEDLISA